MSDKTKLHSNHEMAIPLLKWADFNIQLECFMQIRGVETREALIRDLVCDGQPADESCIGHPVLAEDGIMGAWEEVILEEVAAPFYIGRLINGGGSYAWEFAKKMRDYDYSQTPRAINFCDEGKHTFSNLNSKCMTCGYDYTQETANGK